MVSIAAFHPGSPRNCSELDCVSLRQVRLLKFKNSDCVSITKAPVYALTIAAIPKHVYMLFVVDQ